MQNNVLDYIQTHRDRYVDELKTWLAIPSISALPEHAGDVRRAAEWAEAEMTRVGLQNVRLIDTPGNPVVYGEWLERTRRPDGALLRALRRAARGPDRPLELAAVRGHRA